MTVYGLLRGISHNFDEIEEVIPNRRHDGETADGAEDRTDRQKYTSGKAPSCQREDDKRSKRCEQRCRRSGEEQRVNDVHGESVDLFDGAEGLRLHAEERTRSQPDQYRARDRRQHGSEGSDEGHAA
jgi:hypothetical protein